MGGVTRSWSVWDRPSPFRPRGCRLLRECVLSARLWGHCCCRGATSHPSGLLSQPGASVLAFVYRRPSCSQGSERLARAWQVALLTRRRPGAQEGGEGPGPPPRPSLWERLGMGVWGQGFTVRAAGPPGGPGPSLPALGPEPCPSRRSSNMRGRRHLCPVFSLTPFECEQNF